MGKLNAKKMGIVGILMVAALAASAVTPATTPACAQHAPAEIHMVVPPTQWFDIALELEEKGWHDITWQRATNAQGTTQYHLDAECPQAGL